MKKNLIFSGNRTSKVIFLISALLFVNQIQTSLLLTEKAEHQKTMSNEKYPKKILANSVSRRLRVNPWNSHPDGSFSPSSLNHVDLFDTKPDHLGKLFPDI